MAVNLPNQVVGDLRVYGSLTPDTLVAPASSIGSTQFNASDPLAIAKQRHKVFANHHQEGTAVSATKVVHYARAAGTISAVRAGSVVACVGAATIVVDVKKNGVSILTGTFTLDNANTAYTPESGTLATTTYAAGDVLTSVVVATAGGGTLGSGLFVEVDLDEAP